MANTTSIGHFSFLLSLGSDKFFLTKAIFRGNHKKKLRKKIRHEERGTSHTNKKRHPKLPLPCRMVIFSILFISNILLFSFHNKRTYFKDDTNNISKQQQNFVNGRNRKIRKDIHQNKQCNKNRQNNKHIFQPFSNQPFSNLQFCIKKICVKQKFKHYGNKKILYIACGPCQIQVPEAANGSGPGRSRASRTVAFPTFKKHYFICNAGVF